LKIKKSARVGTQDGFTLIEIISVMVIMAVIVSVAIKKFDLLSNRASITALQSGIRELRTRESIVWFDIKLSDGGYTNDVDVYNSVDKSLGPEYIWNPGPEISGGSLHFKSHAIDLTRVESTPNSPGSWL